MELTVLNNVLNLYTLRLLSVLVKRIFRILFQKVYRKYCFYRWYFDRHKCLHILKSNLEKVPPDLVYWKIFTSYEITIRSIKLGLYKNDCLTIYIYIYMHTPAQSSDINPIEYLWEEIGKRLKNFEISSKKRSKQKILDTWNSIEPKMTEKLVHSTRQRLAEVIKVKQDSTKY